MTDKQINTCKFFDICDAACSGTLEDTEMCHCYELYKHLERKEQELQQAMDNYVQLDLQRVKEYNELVDLYKAKKQKCEEYKQTLIEIKEIAKYDVYITRADLRFKLDLVKNKISEVLDDRQK